MRERVLWNCPSCDVSEFDTPDVIAFLVAAHKCPRREIGPDEAKIRAQTGVGLMGL